MKTIYFFIALLGLSVSVFAEDFSVSVGNIRNNNGNILVMLQADEKSKPVYGMAKAQKGEVNVMIKDVSGKEVTISVFHDENENWQMDTNEQGMPSEGFAREKYHLKEGNRCKLKLCYLTNSSAQ